MSAAKKPIVQKKSSAAQEFGASKSLKREKCGVSPPHQLTQSLTKWSVFTPFFLQMFFRVLSMFERMEWLFQNLPGPHGTLRQMKLTPNPFHLLTVGIYNWKRPLKCKHLRWKLCSRGVDNPVDHFQGQTFLKNVSSIFRFKSEVKFPETQKKQIIEATACYDLTTEVHWMSPKSPPNVAMIQ